MLVGHADAADRGLGALAALAGVREGGRVVVGRRDRATGSHRVPARRTVAKEGLGGVRRVPARGAPALTLVTCAGPYLPDEGGHRNDLTVTAVEAPDARRVRPAV
ncbi:sortase family protein [Streptomyces roseolus]|uniref:class F sortase n=1 Tax=Streptomyces roseolus TaxID=67358 RepID=UPI00364A4C65